MESNYLTTGDLALYENRRGYGCGCGYDDYRHRGHSAAATTGIGLAAGLGGGALLLAIAAAWGVNSASQARARGAENAIAQQSKTMELIAATVNREATRADGINIDVNQTLRSLTSAAAQGGAASANANALATAEALALLQNSGNSALNSAIGGCNFLRVARYSAPQPCPCDTCNA